MLLALADRHVPLAKSLGYGWPSPSWRAYEVCSAVTVRQGPSSSVCQSEITILIRGMVSCTWSAAQCRQIRAPEEHGPPHIAQALRLLLVSASAIAGMVSVLRLRATVWRRGVTSAPRWAGYIMRV